MEWKTATNNTYVNEKGKIINRTQKSTKMAEAKDAYELVSDTNNQIERAYADYANKMKALGNQARLEYINTPGLKYSPEAKKKYAEEVKSLNHQLNIAKMNAPREREAQRLANMVVGAKKKDNPDMTKEEIKKHSQRALIDARAKVGAQRQPIVINDKEWEAIQAGAISDNNLMEILTYTDIDALRERATPRQKIQLSEGKIGRLRAMENSGYTISEIAEALGVSTSTVSNYL